MKQDRFRFLPLCLWRLRLSAFHPSYGDLYVSTYSNKDILHHPYLKFTAHSAFTREKTHTRFTVITATNTPQ